ncbi:MAG: serine hydrolase [Proteobacteria bacterium]|nr:serine hydrolase [Pseudomonadota bacterium]
MSSERLERVGEAMRRMIADEQIPGTVTLIARKGKVVHFEANGLRDVARKLPMQKDTIFRLYSQSKPVTGVAVMMLFEEGRFLLSDPVSKYLPEFANMQVYAGTKDGEVVTEPARPMTIHQLLTHTSGLTYDFFPTPVGEMYRQRGVVGSVSVAGELEPGTQSARDKGELELQSLQQWSERLASVPLVSQPGSAWNYSVGMDVLGRLVEVVSGQSFGDFMNQRIFVPLNMVDTGFHVPPEKLSRFAANYSPAGVAGGLVLLDDPMASPYSLPPSIEMGGSGLVGTVEDYLKFALMLANGGEYNGVRLLSPKTTEFMMANHMTPNIAADPLTSLEGLMTGSRSWGMGFGLTGSVVTNAAISGLPVSNGTFSWGGAATTHFWVDPEEDIVGLVHTQLLPDGTYPVKQMMQLMTYQALIDIE